MTPTRSAGPEGTEARPADTTPIRIGISSCLLGQKVRYDGGHKHDRYLTDTLGNYFEWVPVCPEVEIGLGTPREPIRLVRIDGGVRLVGTAAVGDITERMRAYSRRRVEQLARLDLSGYILKRASPSCGMARVKVHPEKGRALRNGRGLFAEALMEGLPHLPVEEEGRLCDPTLRENWVERVFAYHALQELWRRRWTLGDLVRFHTRYKMVLLAHSEREYRALGRLVAGGRGLSRASLREQYEAGFMSAMSRIATPRKNANVLQHIAGHLKPILDGDARTELATLIDDYREHRVPLIVPLTLIRHHARSADVPYLQGQAYLDPHPKELGLRNHV